MTKEKPRLQCDRPGDESDSRSMFIAESDDAFKYQFTQSLRDMLSPDQAGAFILALANSLQDEPLRSALNADIEALFTAIRTNLTSNDMAVTADDLSVFRALERSGIGCLSAWQTRLKGNWELVFNPMRSLRPARSSGEGFSTIKRAFEHGKFSFNQPFLKPEIFWEGRWGGTQLRVLYNKFPFAPYHMIIVPDPDRCLPQYLTPAYHELVWQLIERQQAAMPGLAAGYNSLGACASVNQLHVQGFIRKQPLPVERLQWVHNGGIDVYPLSCAAFDSVQASWQRIDALNRDNQPYNLLYRPGRCYVMPRVPQGSDKVSPRASGAGWIEMSGVFNVVDRAELESVTAAELENCLRSLSVNG